MRGVRVSVGTTVDAHVRPTTGTCGHECVYVCVYTCLVCRHTHNRFSEDLRETTDFGREGTLRVHRTQRT